MLMSVTLKPPEASARWILNDIAPGAAVVAFSSGRTGWRHIGQRFERSNQSSMQELQNSWPQGTRVASCILPKQMAQASPSLCALKAKGSSSSSKAFAESAPTVSWGFPNSTSPGDASSTSMDKREAPVDGAKMGRPWTARSSFATILAANAPLKSPAVTWRCNHRLVCSGASAHLLGSPRGQSQGLTSRRPSPAMPSLTCISPAPPRGQAAPDRSKSASKGSSSEASISVRSTMPQASARRTAPSLDRHPNARPQAQAANKKESARALVGM
mmetsp:Transcript_50204/g.144703  ORF Transcript_50204/g.144703 Transcript_50204/m.144703 type:complete len:272 (-) Transcript_50204:62-877(-)